MQNWRTTASGLIAALATILPIFGVSATVATSVQTVAMAVWAILSKDAQTSGTTKI